MPPCQASQDSLPLTEVRVTPRTDVRLHLKKAPGRAGCPQPGSLICVTRCLKFGAHGREHACPDSLWLRRRQELRSGRERPPEGWDSDLSTKDWTSGQRLCSRGAGASDKEAGGTSGALPPGSQLGDGGGPLGARGVTARSVNEKTSGWPRHRFHYCRRHGLLKRGAGVPRDRGEQNTLLVQPFQGASGTAPSSGLPAAREKWPQAHAATRLHRARKSRGGRNEGGPRASQHPQRAVTILVPGVTRPLGQTTTHSHEAFQQADARHRGVQWLWTSPP